MALAMRGSNDTKVRILYTPLGLPTMLQSPILIGCKSSIPSRQNMLQCKTDGITVQKSVVVDAFDSNSFLSTKKKTAHVYGLFCKFAISNPLDAALAFNKLYDALQTEQKNLLNDIEVDVHKAI